MTQTKRIIAIGTINGIGGFGFELRCDPDGTFRWYGENNTWDGWEYTSADAACQEWKLACQWVYPNSRVTLRAWRGGPCEELYRELPATPESDLEARRRQA